MTTVESMFDLAIELRDNGQLQDSIKVLSTILKDYPTYERLDIVYSILGGIYSDLKESENALVSFKMATQLNPKSEIASLGLYISYAEFSRYEEAMLELFRFLTRFPANYYKDTLEELLEGLEDGYMSKYEIEIRELAKLNGVELPGKQI